MSRFALAFLAIVCAIAAFPHRTLAQNAESEADRRVQDAISRQEETIDPTPPACRLKNRLPGQIVVCRNKEENERQKLPLPIEHDTSRTTGDGTPRAPDVYGLKPLPFGVGISLKGCFIPPCPPAPVYYFDITRLPEPPAGSDADKIARGEAPAR